MAIRRRKRCPFCRCLFWPDRRTEWRQWACSKESCQAARRKESQQRWRSKNRSDGAARRYRAEVSAAKEGTAPCPPRGGVLDAFPWDEMRDELEPQVLVTLAFFARLLVSALEDVDGYPDPHFVGYQRA